MGIGVEKGLLTLILLGGNSGASQAQRKDQHHPGDFDPPSALGSFRYWLEIFWGGQDVAEPPMAEPGKRY